MRYRLLSSMQCGFPQMTLAILLKCVTPQKKMYNQSEDFRLFLHLAALKMECMWTVISDKTLEICIFHCFPKFY